MKKKIIYFHTYKISLFRLKQVYLPWEKIIPKDTLKGSTVIGLLIFFSYAIVANTVVPISLYVSVEVGNWIRNSMYDSSYNIYLLVSI